MDLRDRIAWNSLVTFGTNIGSRLVKLVGSILFASIAGSAALGVLYLFMSVFRVSKRITSVGMGQAIVVDVVEALTDGGHEHAGRIVASALTVRLVPFVVIGLGIVVAGERVNTYIGLDNAGLYLLIVLFANIVFSTARAALNGFKRVDISSSLDILRDFLVTVIQVAFILAGLKAFGLVVGYLIGLVAVTGLAVVLVTPRLGSFRPTMERARSLVSFAKFSFLDSLVGGEQLWLDIMMLGLFSMITQSDIGIYGIAYSLAMFGLTLSSAISRSILPEISDLAAIEANDSQEETIAEALRYATFMSIPMLFGALAVGDLVLGEIYSFTQGVTVLITLATGIVAYSVYEPLHQTLYGLDHPEYAFGISLSTASLNGVLNAIFIPSLGILGTAISTAIAMGFALILGIATLLWIGIRVRIPFRSWLLQGAAAIVMAGGILGIREVLPSETVVYTVALVLVGGATYGVITFIGDPKIRMYLYKRVAQ